MVIITTKMIILIIIIITGYKHKGRTVGKEE
jgi:hypothetical protein